MSNQLPPTRNPQDGSLNQLAQSPIHPAPGPLANIARRPEVPASTETSSMLEPAGEVQTPAQQELQQVRASEQDQARELQQRMQAELKRAEHITFGAFIDLFLQSTTKNPFSGKLDSDNVAMISTRYADMRIRGKFEIDGTTIAITTPTAEKDFYPREAASFLFSHGVRTFVVEYRGATITRGEHTETFLAVIGEVRYEEKEEANAVNTTNPLPDQKSLPGGNECVSSVQKHGAPT